MKYRITQNPNYRTGEKREKPLHVIGPDTPPRAGKLRRNLSGTVSIIRGNEVEIESATFTDQDLLQKLKTFLDKISIEYKLI